MRPIDQEICSLLKVRKIGGMELLFREYYKPLVVWATTFLHDTQRAEDIAGLFRETLGKTLFRITSGNVEILLVHLYS